MIDDKTWDMLLCNSSVRQLLICVIEQGKTPHSNDPYQIAYNSGKRAIGEWIEQECKRVDFNAYLTMLREQNDRERTNS